MSEGSHTQDHVRQENYHSESSNSESLRQQVFALLDKNPLLTPEMLCKQIETTYKKHGKYFANLRSTWKSHYKDRLGLKCPSFHGLHGSVSVPKSIDRAKASSVGWIQSKAKNRMLVWKDELGRLEWFETGRCKVWLRPPRSSKGHALQLVCNGFSLSGLVSDIKVLDAILTSLSKKGGAATFDTGQRLPYLMIDLFKLSNGIKIKLGDATHPTCLEVEFCYPDWAEKNEVALRQNTKAFQQFSEFLRDFSTPRKPSKDASEMVV